MSPSYARQGFTLVELLVVITVIAILASMLVPAVGLVRERANQQACGKNQNQIITACIAYSGDFDAPWPIGADGDAAKLAAATSAALAKPITNRCFEVLAATMTLPNNLFKCRSNASLGAPDIKPKLDRTDDTWGGGTTKGNSYAFDWAAPGDPSSVRVMTADRTEKNHKAAVMASFGDGHTKLMKTNTTDAAGSNKTQGGPAKQVLNTDASGTDDDTATTADNIFDDDGDAAPSNNVFAVGGASPRRAFLK